MRDLRPAAFVAYRRGDTIIIEGEVDALSAPRLEAALAQLPGPAAVLEVGNLRFADAAALSVLARYAASRPGGRPVDVRGLSGALQRCWNLLGFEEAVSAP